LISIYITSDCHNTYTFMKYSPDRPGKIQEKAGLNAIGMVCT